MASPVLLDRSLNSIAAFLDTERCNDNVFVLGYRRVRAFPTLDLQILVSRPTPALMSPELASHYKTSFLSDHTGLYANLAKLNLPYPEAVFDIHYFQNNPRPFYTLARDIAPGKFIPTPTHAFIRLLHAKGKLHTCFTQNIDTLERIAGVPPEKVVEAHGSFAASRCIECKMPYDHDKMKLFISEARIPRCEEEGCDGLVKPDIVFFGESLPREFIQAIPALRSSALVIIMGTSLKVHPFALLPNLVPRECPRLLLNLEPAGNIGAQSTGHLTRDKEAGSDSEDEEDEYRTEGEEEEAKPVWTNDVVHLGPCDKSVRELCDLLGWRDELEALWKELGGKGSGAANNQGNTTTTTNVNRTANSNGTANTNDTVTDGDHNVNAEGPGKNSGSIEPDESAKKLQRDQSDGINAHAPEGQEGSGDLKGVKDNSVEKTLGLIIQDMEGALKLSANDADEGSALDSNK